MKRLTKLAGKALLWITLLVVTFGGALAAEVQPNAINVYLTGDSTVKSYGPSRGEGGWGEYLQNYFNNKVTIINKSEGGRSSRSFINEGRLQDVLNGIKPGDYLFIQFGHNDCSVAHSLERYAPIGTPDAKGVYPVTAGNLVETPAELFASKPMHGKTYYAHGSGGTFKWYLKQFVDGAKGKGATPVLVTPVSRMYFSGTAIREHHDDNTSQGNAYVTAVKQLAAEEGILCIDMFEITKAMYERLGIDQASRMQFVKNGGAVDNTHYNKYGGFYVGGLMAEAIKKANISISPYVQKPTEFVTMDTTELILVGDSTVCQYGVDGNYRVGRNGYGMQLGNYLNDKVSIRNLAISGKSTKDFLNYPEYKTMLSKLDLGDYLMIGFGHNDQKPGERYSDPYGSITTEGSTKYNLYNYYIKPALDKGATPILVTPIVRRKFNSDGTITPDHGQWEVAIRELAQELGIDLIEGTKLTCEYYGQIGRDTAGMLHAEYTDNYLKSKKYVNADGTLDETKRIDNTHLNAYGAKTVAYLLANALKESNCSLKEFVKESLPMPLP